MSLTCCLHGTFPLKRNFLFLCDLRIEPRPTLKCMKTTRWSKKHFKNTGAQALLTGILIQQVWEEVEESGLVRRPVKDFDVRTHPTWGTSDIHRSAQLCVWHKVGALEMRVPLPPASVG